MISCLRFTAVVMFLCLMGGAAKASSLYAASPYNVFVFGGFTETGSDDGGRLAVGGNASFAGYYAIGEGVLDGQSAPNNDSLVVGGQITQGTANIFGGANAYVGNESGGGGVQFNGGGSESTGSPDPINFATAYTELSGLSSSLATLTANGTVTDMFGTLTLTGTSSGVNIFDIAGSMLSGSSTVAIVIPVGATAIINVTGTSVATTSGGMTVNGYAVNGDSTNAVVDDVLFNFFQATSLALDGGFLGTVLAPNAAVTGGYGQLDGQLIAQSFTGSTEFHDYDFDGTVPVSATPEPGTWISLAAGLAGLGAARRRFRKID